MQCSSPELKQLVVAPTVVAFDKILMVTDASIFRSNTAALVGLLVGTWADIDILSINFNFIEWNSNDNTIIIINSNLLYRICHVIFKIRLKDKKKNCNHVGYETISVLTEMHSYNQVKASHTFY